MNMIHRFMGCIREYKKPTILTLLCMVGEVAIEVLIPFFTANLVNEIKGGAEISGVVRMGLGLILMSLESLGCDVGAAVGALWGWKLLWGERTRLPAYLTLVCAVLLP